MSEADPLSWSLVGREPDESGALDLSLAELNDALRAATGATFSGRMLTRAERRAARGGVNDLARYIICLTRKLSTANQRVAELEAGSDIPRHLRLALGNAQRAFEAHDRLAFGTINEDVQPVADAALAWISKLEADLAFERKRSAATVTAVEIAEKRGLRDDESPDEWAGRIVRERDEAQTTLRDLRALLDYVAHVGWDASCEAAAADVLGSEDVTRLNRYAVRVARERDEARAEGDKRNAQLDAARTRIADLERQLADDDWIRELDVNADPELRCRVNPTRHITNPALRDLPQVKALAEKRAREFYAALPPMSSQRTPRSVRQMSTSTEPEMVVVGAMTTEWEEQAPEWCEAIVSAHLNIITDLNLDTGWDAMALLIAEAVGWDWVPWQVSHAIAEGGDLWDKLLRDAKIPYDGTIVFVRPVLSVLEAVALHVLTRESAP